jgi:hypothetical protein
MGAELKNYKPQISHFQHKVLCSHLVWCGHQVRPHTQISVEHCLFNNLIFSITVSFLHPLGYISCLGEPFPHLYWLYRGHSVRSTGSIFKEMLYIEIQIEMQKSQSY